MTQINAAARLKASNSVVAALGGKEIEAAGKKAAKEAGVKPKSVFVYDDMMIVFVFDSATKPKAAQLKDMQTRFVKSGVIKAPYKVGKLTIDPDQADMVDDPETEVAYSMTFFR